MNTSTKPADLIEKLVSNHAQGKPLLEGAVLYRGTRLPDQALGHFGKELHTSLLPQVAASYTHNWKAGGQAYIGTYPLDRESTKFYADFGMEKTGVSAPKAYSVAEVEKALAPLVHNLASAKSPQDKAKAEQQLESLLKTSFYEAGVPAKQANGEPTRPQQLFAYEGRPDTSHRRAVTMQMSPMSAWHEKTARLQMLTEHKSPAMQKMVEMLAVRNQATAAVSVLLGVAARDHTKELMGAHATKPLSQLVKDVNNHPTSDLQERLAKFANAIQAGVSSSNPATQAKATLLAAEVAKLDPNKASYADLVGISASVNAKTAAAQNGAGSAASANQSHPGAAQSPRSGPTSLSR